MRLVIAVASILQFFRHNVSVKPCFGILTDTAITQNHNFQSFVIVVFGPCCVVVLEARDMATLWLQKLWPQGPRGV